MRRGGWYGKPPGNQIPDDRRHQTNENNGQDIHSLLRHHNLGYSISNAELANDEFGNKKRQS